MEQKKLQILVPQYKETDEVIAYLLDSIKIQQGIKMDEIGVIICNDGSDTLLSEPFLQSYPYEIQYLKMPHRGVSAARNFCIDHANAEYVMFCDADDMFISSLGLWLIFNEITDGGFDDLNSEFLAEEPNRETGESEYGIYDRDGIFVHGKVFRRQYLLDQRIRFNERLSVCEDCNFVGLAQSLTTNHRYITKPFYLWKWRDDSVSRGDHAFSFRVQLQMLESNRDLLEKLLYRELPDAAAGYAAQMILSIYYFNAELKKYDLEEYEKILNGFLDWYKTYGFLWEGLPSSDKTYIIEQLYSEMAQNEPKEELGAIEEWLCDLINR